MKFEINDLVLGDGTNYHLSAPVEGLERPPTRTSSANYSGQHGGRVDGQFYGARLITVTGFIKNSTCDAHEEARNALVAALPIQQDLDVTVTTFVGSQFLTSARVLDLKMPIIHAKFSSYKIDLFCGDSNLYIGSESQLAIPRYTSGGVVLPVILPAVLGAGAGEVTATNDGTTITYPIITITGSAHNPKITNVDTGQKVEVSLTMSGADVLVINMHPTRHTITLNGGSVLSLRTSDSDWFGLEVGDTHFRYDTTDGADSGTVLMTWRNAVEGI